MKPGGFRQVWKGAYGEAYRKAQRETVEGGRRRGVPRAAVLRIPAVHQPARQPFRGGEQRYRRTRGTAREKSELATVRNRCAEHQSQRSEQNTRQPERRRIARQRKRRQRHHAPRRGRPGTGGDARRFAAMGEHGRRQRIQRQHQRLRGAPAGHRSRGQRAVGGRRRIHADHGPARIVQLRRTLLRQRAAAGLAGAHLDVADVRRRSKSRRSDQWRA